MPRPSVFIADQFREVDQSLSGVDRSGEIKAQSLQTLGQGLQQFGSGLSNYFANKKRVDERLLVDDATNGAMSASQASLDATLNSPDFNPDGSNMVDLFNSNYEDLKTQYIDNLKSPEAKEQAGIIFERQRLARTEGLFQEQRKQHLQYTLDKSEQNRIGYNGQVMQNPDLFNKTLQSIEDANTNLLENGVLTPDKVDAVRTKSRKDLIYSAIDGMTLLRQDYSKAIGDVVQGRFSQLLTGDEKSKLIQIIQQRKLQAANLEIQDINRQQAEDKRLREQNQRQTFSDLFQQASDSKDSDTRASIAQKVDQAIGSQLLSREDGEYIRSFMSKPKIGNFDDQSRSFEITSMIVDGQNLDEVNRIVKRDVVAGKLNPNTGEGLLQKIETAKERSNTSGSTVYKEKMKLAQDHLDALFGSKTMFDSLPGFETERRLKRNQAGSMLLDRMLENPDLDPRQAAVLVGQELGGMDIRSYPPVAGIPSDKQDTVKELTEQIAIMESKFRSGTISKEKRSQVILQLKQRIDTIKTIEATKVEVNALSQQLMQKRNTNSKVTGEGQ